MRTKSTRTVFLMTLLCSLFLTVPASATVTSVASMQSEKSIKKATKRQDKIHKKIHKIQNRIIKAKEKAGIEVLDDAGFLEGTDDRVRWGLVGVVGGLLLSLILTNALAFIGWLAVVGGLGLLVWYLIDP